MMQLMRHFYVLISHFFFDFHITSLISRYLLAPCMSQIVQVSCSVVVLMGKRPECGRPTLLVSPLYFSRAEKLASAIPQK